MKKIGLLIFLFALAIGLSFSGSWKFRSFGGVRGSGTAKTETRDVSGFKNIEASGAVTVEVSAQKDFKVEVQADDNLIQNIKTEVNGDTLEIHSEGMISPKTSIVIKVSMPELSSVNISGASTANISNVKADSLDLEASGASKIRISGESQKLNSEASGASKIDAEGLLVQDAEVEASGASSTTVSASSKVKADASGASTIYYTGEPKNLDLNDSGASSVKRK